MNVPKIEIEQDDQGGLWRWTVKDFVRNRVISQSLDGFYDELECIEDLKSFGRLITAFAAAREKQLITAADV
jgi:hypothetical protein